MKGVQKMAFLSIDQRLFVISETIRKIEQYFVHWEDSIIRPEELSNLTSSYFKKAVEIETQYEFTLLMWELIGGLRNGHTWYADKTVLPQYGLLKFIPEPTSNEWIVKNSFDEELKIGDLIISVNGKNLNEWYQDLGKYIGAKKESSRKLKLVHILPYFLNNKKIEIEYLDSKGALKAKNMNCLDINNFIRLYKKDSAVTLGMLD